MPVVKVVLTRKHSVRQYETMDVIAEAQGETEGDETAHDAQMRLARECAKTLKAVLLGAVKHAKEGAL